jgi:plastocyanin
MRKWLALLLACLALGLVVAGCGDDDDDGGGGGGAEVTMEGIAFNPAEITVAAGDTVTWTNDDSAGHDVTADEFESGEPGGIAQGDTFEHTFEEAGTFDYVCTVHPGMEGTVTVE